MNFKDIKLNKKLLYILLIVFLIPIIILSVINLTPSHKDLRTLNTYACRINEINSKLSDCYNDKGLKTDDCADIVANGLIDLNSINDKLGSLDVCSEMQPAKSALTEALSYNISIYNYFLDLIKNPSDNDIVTNYNKYYTDYSLCIKCYDNLSSLGIKYSFPKSADDFFKTSFNYFNTLIKVNAQSNIKNDQNKAYYNNLNEICDSLNDISEDLKPALNSIHKEKREFTSLLNDIRIKESKLNEIKNKSCSLTIPEDGQNCYDIMKDTINYYDLYITDLEHSIIVEKSSKLDEKEIEDNYSNSFSKYEDYLKSYKDFSAELDNFNKK